MRSPSACLMIEPNFVFDMLLAVNLKQNYFCGDEYFKITAIRLVLSYETSVC